MTAREQLLAELKHDEGLRLTLYQDQVGKWTIGYGRNLSDVGISHAEALLLLEHDLDRATAAVLERIPLAVHLGAVRQAVLVNMAFNLGIGGLLGFRKMLMALERGDYPGAAAEMLDSTWATQVGARARRLADQMRSGEWR